MQCAQKTWIHPQREQWVQAMTASIDLLPEGVDSQGETNIYRV